MTEQELKKVIKVIKSYMHIDYLSNGSCKNVLDSIGLSYVEKELKEMIEK